MKLLLIDSQSVGFQTIYIRNRGIEHYNKQHASQGLATLLEMKIPFMLTPLWV
jgi:hypothetical protein